MMLKSTVIGSRARTARVNHSTTTKRSNTRRNVTVAGLSFEAAPVEALIGGGVFVAGAAAFLIAEAVKSMKGDAPAAAGSAPAPAEAPKPPPLPRKNAVLVFGATGRSGREIVRQLLASGRTVVAAVRSTDTFNNVFQPLGISEGRQSSNQGILFVESGIDITRSDETITSDLFKGVSQVVSVVGSVFGRTADGAMGYLDGLTPEVVDANGVANIASFTSKYLPATQQQQRATTTILPLTNEEEIAVFERLDDVIMGGSSSSQITASEDGQGAVWKGQLIVEGGGFCGARTKPQAMNLSNADGIYLRVASSAGQTFKLNVKTDTFSEPEDTYQATFDTLPNGQWTNVYLPWNEFVPVKRARSVPNGPPISPSTVRQFGLVLSKFYYNGYPNDRVSPGPFELKIEGGIGTYTDVKPQLLMVSSAGVERNAKIGDDVEARKQDIPIVQLNPGGVLNWKYKGEGAVRSVGRPYTVIRACGLTNEDEDKAFILEASQGDRVSGKLSRAELARAVVTALAAPAAVGKTIELRRGQLGTASTTDDLRLFLGSFQDRERTRIGLEPFPGWVPPPPPVTEERKEEILADPRVKAAAAADNRGGRVRSEEESKTDGSGDEEKVVKKEEKEVVKV